MKLNNLAFCKAAILSMSIFQAFPAMAGIQPYPSSTLITGVTFDYSTFHQLAPGSDNWPITWAADGHQYTLWGDGGGFGGTNANGRVSLGAARIEGSADTYTGVNIWGGFNPESSETPPGGKSVGIISIRGGELYMYRNGTGSTAGAYNQTELWKSTNNGQNWSKTGIEWLNSPGFFSPTFLQFGKDNAGARDSYIYSYAPVHTGDSTWEVQIPGKIILWRVPVSEIENTLAYQYFSGSTTSPAWDSTLANATPVFEDAVNGVMRTSVSYNFKTGRYILITNHTDRSSGNIGIFEAPEPWGPWKTVLFNRGWPSGGQFEASTFFWNISQKWTAEQSGQGDFVMVFTGRNSMDAWNYIKGHFLLAHTQENGTDTIQPGVLLLLKK